jgi:hypothetical protein
LFNIPFPLLISTLRSSLWRLPTLITLDLQPPLCSFRALFPAYSYDHEFWLLFSLECKLCEGTDGIYFLTNRSAIRRIVQNMCKTINVSHFQKHIVK